MSIIVIMINGSLHFICHIDIAKETIKIENHPYSKIACMSKYFQSITHPGLDCTKQ